MPMIFKFFKNILFVLIIFFYFAAAVKAAEQQIIIIPPDVEYVNQCATNDVYAELYASLGKSVYFNMKSALIKFNNLDKVREQKLDYRASTVVSACCKKNKVIEMFYQNCQDNSNKLKGLCRNLRCHIILWGSFETQWRQEIGKCYRTDDDCEIGLTLYAYNENKKTIKKTIILVYKDKYTKFSGNSQQKIADTVVELMEKIHFEENTLSEN